MAMSSPVATVTVDRPLPPPPMASLLDQEKVHGLWAMTQSQLDLLGDFGKIRESR